MSDIFREIDEDIQHERLKAMWQLFGPWVIGAALVIIIGVAGRVGWNSYVQNQQEQQSLRFGAAQNMLVEGDRDAALQALNELSGDGSTGYGALAAFVQAAELINADDGAGALAIYDGMAADGNLSERMQDLARVLAVMTAMDIEGSDSLRARLAPLATEGGDWYYSARELLGLVEMSDGNFSEAQSILSDLMVDQFTPQGVRQRAQEILEVVEAQMGTIDVAPVDATEPQAAVNEADQKGTPQ